MTMHLTRRNLLKGAAGVSVALPLLDSLAARGDEAPPRRLLLLYTPNGVIQDAWFPTRGGSGRPDDFTLNRCHAPLEPFQSKLILTKGIDLKVTSIPPGEPHQKGMGALLTGRPLLEGTFIGGDGSAAGWGSGISVDQRIAQVVGTQTRLGSLLLGVRTMSTLSEVRNRLSYQASAQPLAPQDNPRVAFDQLFSSASTPQGTLEVLRARRRSVLDAVQGQLSTVMSRLGAADRQKLDAHLTMVRELELRLTATPGGAACTPPPPPADLNPDDENAVTVSANVPRGIMENQMDILVTALACDLTRVASLQLGSAINRLRYPWVSSLEEGHALSHMGPSATDQKEQRVRRDIWHAQQLAYLLSRLDGIPEGSGTMLDNTLVWWINEVAVGNTHSQVDMPFLLAGSCGGFFRTGQFVEFSHASHNDLLLSILRAFGIGDATFGHPDFCTGPLTALHA